MQESIVRRAQERGLVSIRVHDLRDWTHDRHRQADDVPYGGGVGMVLKPEPIFEAVEALTRGAETRVVLLSPQGEVLTQALLRELAGPAHLTLICGRYEGVDERVRVGLEAREVSIGDYVLTGGELPALVLLDGVLRLVPGVLGDAESARQDSFAGGLLEAPQYTRPPEYRGLAVPEVLRSGDHARIRRWQRREALRRTLLRRPDLLERAPLSQEDRVLLQEIQDELAQGDPS